MTYDIARLRARSGETLVSLSDVADRLDGLMQDYPEAEWAIDTVARALTHMPATKPFVPADNPWSWPRPEWVGWQEALATQLGSVPESLWRSVVVNVRNYPDRWLQVAGSEADGLVIQVHDPDHMYTALKKLSWTPLKVEGQIGTYWECDATCYSARSAAESAAQALALALCVSPQGVEVEAMTF